MKFGGLNLTEGVVNTNEAVQADNCDISHDALKGLNAHKDVTPDGTSHGLPAWGAAAIRGMFRSNNGLLVAAGSNLYDDNVIIPVGGINFDDNDNDVAFAKIVNNDIAVKSGVDPIVYNGSSMRTMGPPSPPSAAATSTQKKPIFPDRAWHTTTAVGTTKMVLIGGVYGAQVFDGIWESTSDGKSWELKGSMDSSTNGAIYGHAAVASGTDVFISGGRRTKGAAYYSSSVYKWDGTNLTLQTSSAAFGARVYHSMWIHGTDMYVAGGINENGTKLRTVYKAAISSPGTWSLVYDGAVNGTGLPGTFLDGIINPGRAVFEFNSLPTAIVDKANSFLINNANIQINGDNEYQLYMVAEDGAELLAYLNGERIRMYRMNKYIGGEQIYSSSGNYGGGLLIYNRSTDGYEFKANGSAIQSYATELAARQAAEAETINTDTEVRIAVITVRHPSSAYITPQSASGVYPFRFITGFYNYGPDFDAQASPDNKSDLNANIFTSSDGSAPWTSQTTNLANIYGHKSVAVTSGNKLYVALEGADVDSGGRIYNTKTANNLSVFENSTAFGMKSPARPDNLKAMTLHAVFTIFGVSPNERFFMTGYGVASTDGFAAWSEILGGHKGEMRYFFTFKDTTTLLESELSPAYPTEGSLLLNNEIASLTLSGLPSGSAYRLYRFGTSPAIGDDPQFVAQFTTLPYDDITPDIELGDVYDRKGTRDNLPPPQMTDIIFHKESAVLMGIDSNGDIRFSKPNPDHEMWPLDNEIVLDSKALRLAQYQGYIFAFSAGEVTVISGYYLNYATKVIPGAPGVVVPAAGRIPRCVATGQGGIFYLTSDGIYSINTNTSKSVRETELESLNIGASNDAAFGWDKETFVAVYSSGTKGVLIDEDGAYAHNPPLGIAVNLLYLDYQTLKFGSSGGKIYEWEGDTPIELFDYKTVPFDGGTTAPKEYRKITLDAEGNFTVYLYLDESATPEDTYVVAPNNTTRDKFEKDFIYQAKRVQIGLKATDAGNRAKIYSYDLKTTKLVCGGKVHS